MMGDMKKCLICGNICSGSVCEKCGEASFGEAFSDTADDVDVSKVDSSSVSDGQQIVGGTPKRRRGRPRKVTE